MNRRIENLMHNSGYAYPEGAARAQALTAALLDDVAGLLLIFNNLGVQDVPSLVKMLGHVYDKKLYF